MALDRLTKGLDLAFPTRSVLGGARIGALFGLGVFMFHLFTNVVLPGGSEPNEAQILVGLTYLLIVVLPALPWLFAGLPDHLLPWMAVLDLVVLGAVLGFVLHTEKTDQ